MTPRHLTSQIALRTSKALGVAALVIGLAATTFAPASALAAPARDDRADLVLTYDKKYEKGPSQWFGSRDAGIHAIVTNTGSATAETIEVRFVFPPQVIGRNLAYRTEGGADGWTCGKLEQAVETKNRSMYCRTRGLGAGESKSFDIRGMFNEDGDFWIEAAVDPNGLIPESDEANNTLTVTF